MPDPLASLGVTLHHLIAGLAGGLVRALMKPDGHPVQTLSTAIVGALSAAYLTPLVMYFASLPETASLENAVAFTIGLSGMTAAELALRRLRRVLGDGGK